MNREEFLGRLHKLFEADPGTIHFGDGLQQIDGWDSMTFLGLIAMADEQYGVSLQPRQVLACNTVEDLVKLVESPSSGPA